MAVFRHRRVDADQGVEAVEMDEAFAVGARHRRVDLGDHPVGDGEHRRCEVDGNPEADEAAGVGRRDLEQRHVDRQPAGSRAASAPPRGRSAHSRADRWPRGPARRCRRRRFDGGTGSPEAPSPAGRAAVVTKLTNSRSAGPGLHRLQRRKQGARRGTAGAEIDPAAGPDAGERRLWSRRADTVAGRMSCRAFPPPAASAIMKTDTSPRKEKRRDPARVARRHPGSVERWPRQCGGFRRGRERVPAHPRGAGFASAAVPAIAGGPAGDCRSFVVRGTSATRR